MWLVQRLVCFLVGVYWCLCSGGWSWVCPFGKQDCVKGCVWGVYELNMTLGSLSGDGWGCVLSWLVVWPEALNTGACSFWLGAETWSNMGTSGRASPINISGVRNSLGVQWLGLETLQVGLWTHCGHYGHNQSPCPPYMCSQNPQLLKLWLLWSPFWEHFSIQIFHRHWIYQADSGYSIHGFWAEISVLLSHTAPWAQLLVSSLPLCVGHPQVLVPCSGERGQGRNWLGLIYLLREG